MMLSVRFSWQIVFFLAKWRVPEDEVTSADHVSREQSPPIGVYPLAAVLRHPRMYLHGNSDTPEVIIDALFGAKRFIRLL